MSLKANKMWVMNGPFVLKVTGNLDSNSFWGCPIALFTSKIRGGHLGGCWLSTQTLDSSTGHDLLVPGIDPFVMPCTESLGILSLSPLIHAHSHFLKNKVLVTKNVVKHQTAYHPPKIYMVKFFELCYKGGLSRVLSGRANFSMYADGRDWLNKH